jgi:hypothetical protein
VYHDIHVAIKQTRDMNVALQFSPATSILPEFCATSSPTLKANMTENICYFLDAIARRNGRMIVQTSRLRKSVEIHTLY